MQVGRREMSTNKPLSDDIRRFLRYLSFKMECLREQEANPLTVDVEKAQRHFNELEAIKSQKTIALAKVMPQRPKEKYKNKPKVMQKKDGTLSAHGEAWYKLLKEQCLPSTTEGTVTIVEGWEDGNPNSPSQVKEWLYSLGWKPCTYKYDRNKLTGEEKKIEQVRYSSASDPRKGELTDSVLKLKAKEPGIEVLEGLTVATHRMSIFKAFVEGAKIIPCEVCSGEEAKVTFENGVVSGSVFACFACHNKHKYGQVIASAGGLTNTLRLKHRSPIVNLPKVGSPWGEEIRGCIVAPKGTTVCGADVVSLEDNTKRHFLWDYDPDYVTSMMTEGYDPHLSLCQYAGDITEEELGFYRWYQEKN